MHAEEFGGVVVARRDNGSGFGAGSTVANKPLIELSLELLVEAGIREAIIAVEGEHLTRVAMNLVGADAVVTCQEGTGNAHMLHKASRRLKQGVAHIVAIDAAVVVESGIQEVCATHLLRKASMTALLSKRTTPVEGKVGKAPEDVTYIGLDKHRQRLLLRQRSEKAGRQLRIPRVVALMHGSITIESGLSDMCVYVISSRALERTEEGAESIEEGVVPALLSLSLHQEHQTLRFGEQAQQKRSSSKDTANGERRNSNGANESGKGWEESSIGPCCVVEAQEESVCMRVDSLEAYLEANMVVAGREREERSVDATAEVGEKAAVGKGSVVGARAKLGPKCNVKRSVIGERASLGEAAKVSKSVIDSHASLDGGAHVASSVISSHASVGKEASVHSCHVLEGAVVKEQEERRDETIA